MRLIQVGRTRVVARTEDDAVPRIGLNRTEREHDVLRLPAVKESDLWRVMRVLRERVLVDLGLGPSHYLVGPATALQLLVVQEGQRPSSQHEQLVTRDGGWDGELGPLRFMGAPVLADPCGAVQRVVAVPPVDCLFWRGDKPMAYAFTWDIPEPWTGETYELADADLERLSPPRGG